MESLAFLFKAKLGLYARKTPAKPWESFDPRGDELAEYSALWRAKAPALPISQIPREYLSPWLENYAIESGHSPVDEAKAIALGKYRLNATRFVSAGFPPAWNHGLESVTSQHWSKISSQLKPIREMSKELSRFSWALVLVRAWILDGDSAHVENFWKLFEDWLDKNQPHLGPQWCSDEEVARRLMNITWIVQAFRHHPSSTNTRLVKAARFITVSAERLQATFAESVKQASVAGLAVAVALYTAGALWPRLPSSDVWRSDGLEWALDYHLYSLLEVHSSLSPNQYHELLQLAIWLEVVLRSEKETLPESLHQKVTRLLRLSEEQSTEENLTVDLFPLTASAPHNTLLVLQVAQILFSGIRTMISPSEEAALLLCGPLCESAK